MEQANVKWNKQMLNGTSKCEMEQANVKWNKQMWNRTSKCEMEQAKVPMEQANVKSNSDQPVAGYQSMHANRSRTECGSST